MKLAKDFPVGSKVLVGMRYDGAGRFVADNGAGRTYFVQRHCGTSDLYLGDFPDGDWAYIMHVSRLVENGAPPVERVSPYAGRQIAEVNS